MNTSAARSPASTQPVERRPYTRAAQLPEIMRQRIVVLDGAMGTMIQRYKLTEADYRGTRFADHGKDLKGSTSSTWPPVPTSSRPTPSVPPPSRRTTTSCPSWRPR
jgi:hypothetical protein